MASPTSDLPLSDIKIVDLTHHVAGPNCTRMLAAFGAEVIKVERPDGGDPARRLGPFHRDHPHPEKSALFLNLNGNKKSITLNLKSVAGIGILKELAKDADIVVENFRPGVMDRLGISRQALKDLNPRLIVTSISNFGQTGPYRDYKASELVLFGMGGPLLATGLPERRPVKLGGRIVQYQAGLVAALLTMVALFARGPGSRGEYVDVSIMETQTGTFDRMVSFLVAHSYTGQSPTRLPMAAASGSGIFPCRDGYISTLNPSNLGRLSRVLEMIGRSDLVSDPRFATLEERSKPENMAVLDGAFLEWVLNHDMDDIVRTSQKMKVMSGPVYTPADLLGDPQFKARSPWLTFEHPFTGPTLCPGRPMVMYGTPWQLRMPAPLLGQHNREVYCDRLGYSARDLERLRQMRVI